MRLTLFKDDWYHGLISQTLERHDEASPDARILAEALITGLCCIAQAIDHATDANDPNTLAGAVGTLDRIGSEIAEAIKEASEQ